MKIKSALKKKWVLPIYRQSFFCGCHSLFCAQCIFKEKKKLQDVPAWPNHRSCENTRTNSPSFMYLPGFSEHTRVTETPRDNANSHCPFLAPSPHPTPPFPTRAEHRGALPRVYQLAHILPRWDAGLGKQQWFQSFREDTGAHTTPTSEESSLRATHPVGQNDDTGERSTHFSGNIDKIKQRELPGTSLVVQWLRFCLPMQGKWVQSLVGELRSYHASWPKKKNHKAEAIL